MLSNTSAPKTRCLTAIVQVILWEVSLESLLTTLKKTVVHTLVQCHTHILYMYYSMHIAYTLCRQPV
jgi:hypothetical protein